MIQRISTPKQEFKGLSNFYVGPLTEVPAMKKVMSKWTFAKWFENPCQMDWGSYSVNLNHY